MNSYAELSDFTTVYSLKGVSSSEIVNGWLPYGTRRVNESLGGFYTLPFSTNNATARGLTVDYAYLGILVRTRKQEDSIELRNELRYRIASLTSSGAPMLTDSAETIYPSSNVNNVFKVYSSTKDHKPIFDLRDPEYQRADPDQLREEQFEDYGYNYPYDY